jgi:cytochrome oxidase Cu insertion factor (SCO1/SenC/PrrC family)/tetratricopeptide (TPR) repeat protein
VTRGRRLAGALVGVCAAIATVRALGDGPLGVQVIVVGSDAQARQVLARLQHGEDFGAVAREVSIDPSAGQGGLLGYLPPEALRPELRDVATSLKPGQISGIVRLPSSCAIVKLLPPSEAAMGEGMGVSRNLALAARGALRYPPDVAGQVIADLAFRSFPKPAGWEQDLQGICRIRRESLSQLRALLRKRLGEAASASARDAIETHYALAQIAAYEGRMDEAIAEWEAAHRIAVAEVPDGVAQLEAVLGTAYYHRAEMENDAYRVPGERCLFPPRVSAPYAKPADSEQAVQHLTKALARNPDDVQLQWLLNLAYATLGKYPAGVPEGVLIPPSVFDSKETIGRFRDVASAAGLDLFTMAGGVIVDDFDGDGLVDVVTSSYDVCEAMRFFHNDGNGTFSDRTAQAGLEGQLGGLNMVQADYNDDGCLDILVLRGAWEFPIRRSLLRNNCDGTFTDVTRQAGLAEPATRSQTAVWADYDNDGHVDLFVGNEMSPSQLFHNRGDGTFEDVSHAAGIDATAFTKGVAAADYDGDGWVDFYVSNLHGGNFLYHNEHDGTFREVSASAGVHLPQAETFATWFFDYDNDGRPDLFVASYFFSLDAALRSLLGRPHGVETNKLFRNLGSGRFEDVTAAVGLDRVSLPMGANFGDVDNDGFLDLYLATGGPEYSAELPNLLMRNREGRRFVDVTAASGTGELHKGHATAFADLDGDGDEDIVTNAGGATPGDAHALRVFENPGSGNDWIEIELVGVKTNRAALGAEITLAVENEGAAPRAIHRSVTSGGSFGASPLAQHVGLGRKARIVSLEIAWPVSRTRQRFTNVAPNQAITIRELASGYAVRPRHPVHLGGAGGRQAASGLVLSVDPASHTLEVSCAEIPGYRDARPLTVTVAPDGLVDGVVPGASVEFTLAVDGASARAEGLRLSPFDSMEREPQAARRLEILEDLGGAAPTPAALAVGQPVPEFTLIDQAGRPLALSDLAGKVVAMSFIYTRCPLPEYCFRSSQVFAALARRFRERLGRDLALLSVSFDPANDRPAMLADYARTWSADGNGWRFLTGEAAEVQRVCAAFGVRAWPDEAQLTHSLHTVVIDRHGRLAANVEGNRFTPRQMGDLVEAVLRRKD